MSVSLDLTTLLFGMLFLLLEGFRVGRGSRNREALYESLKPTPEEIAEDKRFAKDQAASKVRREREARHAVMVAEFIAEQAPKMAAAKAKRAATS